MSAIFAELSEVLEKLWEVLLMSFDVAGAFDNVWWEALIPCFLAKYAGVAFGFFRSQQL